jgi:hypothetical protein
MKKHFARMTGLLVLAIMAAAQVTKAQQAVIVDVPFDFTAGDTRLPAGQYIVGKASSNSPALRITRADGPEGIFVPSNPAESRAPQAESKLVFHKYGDHYFLAQVWNAGSANGRELMKSNAEKEMALSAQIEKPEQVTLVARLVSAK